MSSVEKSLYDSLVQAVDDNLRSLKGFKKYRNVLSQLRWLKVCAEISFKNVEEITTFVDEYDLDKDTPANGYRSFIDVWKSAIEKSTKVCENLYKTRNSIFFWESFYRK